MKFTFEKFNKNITLLTSSIIFVSLLIRYVYFNQFNINIINYTDPSEIILANLGMYMQLILAL